MKGIEKIHMMLALMLVSLKRRLPETRRLSSGITTLALVGIILLVAAGSASAAPCPAPGDRVITVSCELDQNWIVPAGQAGYIIEADGVTIDGMGLYKITGSVTCANCEGADEATPCTVSGIYINGPAHNARNVVIKNLEIEHFCTGIALKGGFSETDRIDDVTINNCNIHDNGFDTGYVVTHGIHASNIAGGAPGAPALTITGNDIHHNKGTGSGCGDGGAGIFIYGGAPDTKHEYCNISYNELHHNLKAGFWTKMMLTRSDITHNNATENGYGTTDTVRGGIVLRCKKTDENFVAYNNVSNNAGCCDYYGNGVGYGVYVGGCYNTIFDNVACSNSGSGICMGRSDGSAYNNVSCNYACSNSVCDVECKSSCQHNYGDCNTYGICCNCNSSLPDNNSIRRCHYCPGTGIDLKATAVDGAWDPPGQTQYYTITYTVENVAGWNTSSPTHAGIWIDGTLVDTQPVPSLGMDAPAGVEHTNTSGPHPVDPTVVNGAAYIDTIRVCADVNNEETREDNETNNCMSNNFGGPDLVIIPPTAGCVQWIDESWKTYNLRYTVKNAGDIATTDDVWVNFTEINGEWKDCVNPTPIPAGLATGATTTTITAGPFVMGGSENWIEEWVNFNYPCPVNNWNVLHHDRARFTEGYPAEGPCWDANGDIAQCGDANCNGNVLPGDAYDTFNTVQQCDWAADVSGDGRVLPGDAFDSFNGVRNCRKGLCN